jgi:hypothetical protein
MGAPMTYVYDEDLTKAIRMVTRGASVRCAVAFWGSGAEQLFSKSKPPKIICNLQSGGTNPKVIRTLRDAYKAEVKQHDALHAKVYLSESGAVIASANASANGLGFEGSEQAGWREAGVLVEDPPSTIAAWFKSLWQESRPISERDLEIAMVKWRNRRRSKPTLPSFADFDPEQDDVPLVTWWEDDEEWHVIEDSVVSQLGSYSDDLWKRIDLGLLTLGELDEQALVSGRWALVYKRNRNEMPSRSIRWNPYWFFSGPLLREAWAYDATPDVKGNVVIQAELPPPQPFNTTEPRFRRAFFEVLKRPKYSLLRADEEEDWFTKSRLDLMRPFWRDVKVAYSRRS